MYVPEDRLRLFWVAQMRSIQCFSIKLGHVSPSYCLGRYIVVCNRKRTEKTSRGLWFSSCHITLYLSRGVVNVTLSNLWIDSVCGMTCVATSWAFTGASDYMWLDEAQLSLNCKICIMDTFVVPRRWLENIPDILQSTQVAAMAQTFTSNYESLLYCPSGWIPVRLEAGSTNKL